MREQRGERAVRARGRGHGGVLARVEAEAVELKSRREARLGQDVGDPVRAGVADVADDGEGDGRRRDAGARRGEREEEDAAPHPSAYDAAPRRAMASCCADAAPIYSAALAGVLIPS